MFKPQPIKLAKELHFFRKKHNIPMPTDSAFILGGLLASMGHEVTFEAVYDRIHVDVYSKTFNPNIFFEINGVREHGQHVADGNRDGFVVHNQKSIQRMTNSCLANIPETDKIKFYFMGINIYEQQLQKWFVEGIPDYFKTRKDEVDNQNLLELKKDIEDWFD